MVRCRGLEYYLLAITVAFCDSSTTRHIPNPSVRRDVANQSIDYEKNIFPDFLDISPLATHIINHGTKSVDRRLPPTCFGSLCVGIEDYPHDEIKTLLDNKPGLDIYFNREVDVHIEDRFSEIDEGDPLCATYSQTLYPEEAENLNQIKKYIVNVEGFKQGIVIETCVKNAKCRHIDNLISGYKTKCVQRYTIKRLMAVSKGEKDNPEYDSFSVPSCCMCVLEQIKNTKSGN